MKQLTCEMCGSTDLIKQDGVFVCQSCGIKYSVEEAKKMMVEVEGTVAVTVDNSNMVETWMTIANNAIGNGNYKEAYNYYTKVVEVEPENWRAIFGKGKSAAWQSTLANLRIPELYQGVNAALEIVSKLGMSESEIISIKNEFAVELFNFNNAITDLMKKNIDGIDDLYFDSHWDQMCNTRKRFLVNVSQLEDAMSLISDYDDNLSKSNVVEFKKRICEDIINACESYQYWRDYAQSSLGYSGLKATTKKTHLDKYWKLVCEIRESEPQYANASYIHPDPFDPGLHHMKEIDDYWKKKDNEYQIQKTQEIKKRRYDAFWNEHKAEREQFDARIAEIDSEIQNIQVQTKQYDIRISEIRRDLSQRIPSENQLAELKKQLNDLAGEKSKLGLFAGKQKKALQVQIDSLQAQIESVDVAIKRQKKAIQDNVTERITAVESERQPLLDRINALKNEKSHIETELTKDR